MHEAPEAEAAQLPHRRIAVINCNTSSAMTVEIGRGAAAVAAQDTEIIPMQPRWGPESAEGYLDSFLSAAAVLELLIEVGTSVDAVVMAGFGEHGREGARELLRVPVVDITEAGAMHAMLVGHRYGVVTTLSRVAAQIEQSLDGAGLAERCVGVEAADIGVLQVSAQPDRTAAAFAAAGRRVLDRGADVIVLGCAGFTTLHERLRVLLPVPVIDPVAAGVVIAEGLVRTGACTSKAGPFAAPLVKERTRRHPSVPV
ncbi:aspartate/glutamate racemase family protein [Occultella kanbiaonis]|uniref:aspartate/glutamate racemase family protein n=1 Tax=Occultella kanbiaonis TaxID=2675754 RepID=UPI001E3B7BBC|nr:aspartate/glutamate racemase family protein [Occultella kanbiaonis]